MKGLTKKQISKKLTDLGIEHNMNMTKNELIALVPEKKEKQYKVVHRFKDLQDNNKIYRPGDIYDSEGKSQERIKELSTTKNKIGRVLIKEQR